MGGPSSSLVALLAVVVSANLTSAYRVYWNVPSEHCKYRFNISFQYVEEEYGITMNENGKFAGKEVTIFYSPGLFPQVKGYKYDPALKTPNLTDLVYINGGLPQDGNMLQHLNAFEKAVNKLIPDRRSRSIAIIDMENFGATWAQNFGEMMIYKILSRKRVQDKNPTWTTAKVEAQAKLEYERGAINFMVKTLLWAKALRPYCYWGYYQYPQCFNRVGVSYCSKTTQEDNNLLSMMWKRSDALYPSMYLNKEGTVEGREAQIKGYVREAKRAYQFVGLPGMIYPYIWYKYNSGPDYILDEDLKNLIAVPKQEGADGVVLWGSYYDFTTKEGCLRFDDYVRNRLGPIAKMYTS